MQCAVCKKKEEESAKLLYCSKCKAVTYCSRECQKADWRQHKTVCGSLNAGFAAQVSQPLHHERARGVGWQKEDSIAKLKEAPEGRRLWDLFNSTDMSGEAAAAEMKKILQRLSKPNKRRVMFMSVAILLKSPMKDLKKANSLLTVILRSGYVDPNVFSRGDEGTTALHLIAEACADPKDPLTLENQLVLAQQLLDAGADVNARASKKDFNMIAPLHRACSSNSVTNVDLVKLFLDHGADPNAKDSFGQTPLMCTMSYAVGAAMFLLEYDGPIKVDVNAKDKKGSTILNYVRYYQREVSIQCDSPSLSPEEKPVKEFHLRQLKELEELLLAKGAIAGVPL